MSGRTAVAAQAYDEFKRTQLAVPLDDEVKTWTATWGSKHPTGSPATAQGDANVAADERSENPVKL